MPTVQTNTGQYLSEWSSLQNPDALLEDLKGSRFYELAKNDSLWSKVNQRGTNPHDTYVAIMNMINDYRRQLSDETYAEGEIGRVVKAQNAAGINSDLAGISGGNGFVSSPSPSANSYSPSTPDYNPFSPIEEGMNVIGNAFSMAQSLASAVSSVSGLNIDNANKLFELISKGKGMYDEVRERFRGSDTEDLHDFVMETLFGSDGSNGLLSGALPAGKLAKVRQAMDSYGRGTQSGTMDKISDNQSQTGLSQSERDLRKSSFANAAESASGLFETEGELFKIQVEGMKEQTVNELKKVRLEQELAILTGNYDLKRISLLDPSLAAMAQNEQQRALISEAGYNADYFDNRDGASAAGSENAQDVYWSSYWNNKDGKSDAERETRIAEIRKELEELNFKNDKIVLNTEYKALSYLDKHGTLAFDLTRQQNPVDRAHGIRGRKSVDNTPFEVAKQGAHGFFDLLKTLARK